LSISRGGDSLQIAVFGPCADQGTSNLKNYVAAVSEHKVARDEPWKEGERVILSPTQHGQPHEMLWTGRIRKAHDRFNRIVVEEFEVTSDFGPIGSLSHASEIELHGRLVFTDSFEY
jgi:hypothetical protein